MLTPDQLRRIMPNLAAAKAESLLPHLNAAMAEFGIDTMLRTSAFAAQLAHESGEFRWMEEIWGPTSAQKRYEPQTDLSKRLGNSEAGDGLRFKGRGPIQLTGRSNYARFGGLLGLDLIGAPVQAAAPEVAFRIAALFWKNRDLNAFAEAGDFREVTRRINGGFNGFEDRLKYYERAKAVLASGFDAGVPVVTRSAGAAKVDVPAEPLTRGAEAILELAPARKTAARKAGTKKVAARKSAAKKPAAKKPAAKKAAVKKAAVKKAAVKKASTKKPPAKKVAAKKVTAKKAPAKKAPAKKTATKPAAAKKPAPRKLASAKVGRMPSIKRAAAKKAATARKG